MKFGSMVRLAMLVTGLITTACADEGNGPAAPAPQAALTVNAESAPHEHMPLDARVLMLAPQDGELIVGPAHEGRVAVSIRMGLEAARLAPAGHMEHGTGHHHVIVDAPALSAGEPVPFDAQHLHFGKGQTDTEVLLTPGAHRLTLQFADGAHRSYGPQLATSIDIWVEVGAAPHEQNAHAKSASALVR